ncbi:mitochondrial genome maintenance exonuclease 1 [Aulostomus maculatus]
MFVFKRVASVWGACVLVPKWTSLSVSYFSGCQSSLSSKRHSPYSSVDSERYSSLVKSVMSSKVSHQTPETLLAEDEHMYGPVIKDKTPSEPDKGAPRTFHPFLGCQETAETTELESEPPVRISLKRGQGRSSVPSVTRILQQTLSPEQIFYLERWKKRMIAELGEEGFREYSQNLFRQGKLFHSALEEVLVSCASGKDRNLPESAEHPAEVQGYLSSVSHILEDVSAPRAIESKVQHSALNYLGVVDCVARYRGVLCVIDWKTSEKPKPFLGNTYDNPVQVAAYAGALNSDDNYKYQVENGLIVVAYKDGSPAHAHQLSPEQMMDYWKRWLVRLEAFTEIQS